MGDRLYRRPGRAVISAVPGAPSDESAGDAPSIAIQFRDVRRYFGAVKALDGVNFEIVDGEFFSMLGPSGSGKTTSLRLIAGFDQPTEGKSPCTAATWIGYRRSTAT